jgi:hypothetical protein
VLRPPFETAGQSANSLQLLQCGFLKMANPEAWICGALNSAGIANSIRIASI